MPCCRWFKWHISCKGSEIGNHIDIKIPRDNPPSETFAVEDRQCGFLENPLVLESVWYNLRIPNLGEDVIDVKKNSHVQVRRLKTDTESQLEEKHEYPKKPNLHTECHMEDILIDPSGKLFSEDQKSKITRLIYYYVTAN